MEGVELTRVMSPETRDMEQNGDKPEPELTLYEFLQDPDIVSAVTLGPSKTDLTLYFGGVILAKDKQTIVPIARIFSTAAVPSIKATTSDSFSPLHNDEETRLKGLISRLKLESTEFCRKTFNTKTGLLKGGEYTDMHAKDVQRRLRDLDDLRASQLALACQGDTDQRLTVDLWKSTCREVLTDTQKVTVRDTILATLVPFGEEAVRPTGVRSWRLYDAMREEEGSSAGKTGSEAS
jgi:hypothetical protein